MKLVNEEIHYTKIQLRNQIKERISNQVINQVWWQVNSRVRGQIWWQIRFPGTSDETS